ncbi:unnamed protein product [Prorocentrum cordatum]|uniref:Reverse transcriptase domain-containing protein n=1 Tax=Prorocentrum cordatum TaxID=2364126 RepID=A0ABN9PPM0_9DINO|nr:unnamed protein product [Polarella glacialis]
MDRPAGAPCSSALDFVDASHREPSTVILPPVQSLLVDRGAEQGDPLGPLLCAAALARVLARTPAQGGVPFADVWFVDDGQIVTRGQRGPVAAGARRRGRHVLCVDVGGGTVSEQFLAAAGQAVAVRDALNLPEDQSLARAVITCWSMRCPASGPKSKAALYLLACSAVAEGTGWSRMVPVDSRVRTLVENSIKTKTRSLFVIVGDHGRDQVVNLHYMMNKISSTKPSVLWCYKKELGFSSHRKKRMKQENRAHRDAVYSTLKCGDV